MYAETSDHPSQLLQKEKGVRAGVGEKERAAEVLDESSEEGKGMSWHYEEAIAVKHRLGCPVDAGGHFLSITKADGIIVDRAISVLNELFEFMDRLNVKIMDDSEQGVVAIDLNNGFEVVYSNEDVTKANLLRSGHLVGNLERRE